MEAPVAVRFTVDEPSGVGEVRRHAAALASQAAYDETIAGELSLIVTELATNLVKHASGGGEMVIRPVGAGPRGAIEVLALDRGPGIPNVTDALRDRYSSTGTAGIGLGAVRRLADTFDIHSDPGRGTAVYARIDAASRTAAKPPGLRVRSGGFSIAKRGEVESGDGWAERPSEGMTRVMVVDGVGHGPDAARATHEAIRLFESQPTASFGDLFGALHARLHSTRGASIALVDLDPGRETVRFAGVGNIAGAVATPGEPQRHVVSHPGTVGHELGRIHEYDYAWPTGSLLILHSDGARTRWAVDAYPGLVRRDPALVAGVLYRDFERGNDDVTVVALRAVRAA